jgi:hypothetical protein
MAMNGVTDMWRQTGSPAAGAQNTINQGPGAAGVRNAWPRGAHVPCRASSSVTGPPFVTGRARAATWSARC